MRFFIDSWRCGSRTPILGAYFDLCDWSSAPFCAFFFGGLSIVVLRLSIRILGDFAFYVFGFMTFSLPSGPSLLSLIENVVCVRVFSQGLASEKLTSSVSSSFRSCSLSPLSPSKFRNLLRLLPFPSFNAPIEGTASAPPNPFFLPSFSAP